MANQARSIGLIGFGQIGSYIYDQVVLKPELGLSIAFIYDADRSRTESLPRRLVLDHLDGFGSRNADMICEVAHPDVTRDEGRDRFGDPAIGRLFDRLDGEERARAAFLLKPGRAIS